jgi:hypothetical protein
MPHLWPNIWDVWINCSEILCGEKAGDSEKCETLVVVYDVMGN